MAVSNREVYNIIYNNVRNKHLSWTEAQVHSRTKELMKKRYPNKISEEKYLYNGKENVQMRSTEIPTIIGIFLIWIDADTFLLDLKGKRIACSKYFWEALDEKDKA